MIDYELLLMLKTQDHILLMISVKSGVNSRYPRYAIWPRAGACHANHACAALTVSRCVDLSLFSSIENVHRYYKYP